MAWASGRYGENSTCAPARSTRRRRASRAANTRFGVAVKGNGENATAYVSSIRDREIVVVKLSGSPELFNPRGRPSVTTRIPVKGQPNKMTLNAAQSLLYVVEDQSDTVDVIDTAKNTILETIPVIASTVPTRLGAIQGCEPEQRHALAGRDAALRDQRQPELHRGGRAERNQ